MGNPKSPKNPKIQAKKKLKIQNPSPKKIYKSKNLKS
jgi:hypothetical protein